MTWILIMWLTAPRSVVIEQVEFNTQVACLEALNAFKKTDASDFDKTYHEGVCVQKGQNDDKP